MPLPNPPPARTEEPLDEATLVAGLRSGSEAAFEMLVRTYGGRLMAVGRRFLRNEEDARDAVQDALLSAYRSIGSFTGSARISTWLHRIVINSALMKLRSRPRSPEGSIEELLPRFEHDHQASPSEEWNQPAEKAIERRETRDLVRRAIESLPETYRTVLLLRDIEGLDTEETARLLAVTENTVKIRLHRARQALRTLLDPHFRGPRT